MAARGQGLNHPRLDLDGHAALQQLYFHKYSQVFAAPHEFAMKPGPETQKARVAIGALQVRLSVWVQTQLGAQFSISHKNPSGDKVNWAGSSSVSETSRRRK